MQREKPGARSNLTLLLRMCAAVMCLVFCATAFANSQTARKRYALHTFHACGPKGRVQDCGGKLIEQILADKKNAIPTLISQLVETQRTQEQVADFWFDTSTGDVAFIVLTDLFTGSDYKTFHMPSVPGWEVVERGCASTAQACWDRYLRRHGRAYVQRAWQSAWNKHKEHIYWDAKERCFRVEPKAPKSRAASR